MAKCVVCLDPLDLELDLDLDLYPKSKVRLPSYYNTKGLYTEGRFVFSKIGPLR